MGFIDKIKSKFIKPHFPRPDIPEQNDKTKAADRKGVWDGLLLMGLEAIAFVAMFSFSLWALQYGFILGFLITAVLVMVPMFAIILFRMRAQASRSNQAGQYNPVNLIAFNKEGKKYEDHFFTLDVREVLSDELEKFMDDVTLTKPTEPVKAEKLENPTVDFMVSDAKEPVEPVWAESKDAVAPQETVETKEEIPVSEEVKPKVKLKGRLFEITGAFRKKKPLEEFHVLTKYSWGNHVEHNDATETVNLGSVSIKKDMPTVVIRQIGTYGEHKLPLMRVESSCVSRKDEKLFSASMSDVVQADRAIDSYRSTTMEEDKIRMERTINSMQETIDKLKEARERDKKERDQQRVIGEEGEKDKDKPSKWRAAIPFVQLLIIFGLIIAVFFLAFQLGIFGWAVFRPFIFSLFGVFG